MKLNSSNHVKEDREGSMCLLELTDFPNHAETESLIYQIQNGVLKCVHRAGVPQLKPWCGKWNSERPDSSAHFPPPEPVTDMASRSLFCFPRSSWGTQKLCFKKLKFF